MGSFALNLMREVHRHGILGNVLHRLKLTTFLAAENSEVSPVELLVAVAVMFCPRLTIPVLEKPIEALPVPSVITAWE